MKRTRRSVKSYVESSESSEEEDPPPNKKSLPGTPNAATKPQVKSDQLKNSESSSSESDIENYLQRPDKLDLDSEFFNLKPNKEDQKPTENVPDFNSIEKEMFAGISQTNPSDSEQPVKKSVTKKKPNKKSANTKKSKLNLSHGKLTDSDSEEPSQKKEPKSKASSSTQLVQQLEEYTRKIEEAKKFVEIYRAKKEAEEDKANILNLLAAGEGLSALPQQINPADLHSSDFESCDSEQEGWEEIVQKEEPKDDQKDVPKKNIEIAINMPDAVKKKKGVDLLAAMKRRLNRIRKENQVLIHKVHLLCWIAHGNHLNTAINSTQTLGMALSLLPSEQCYPADRTDLSYLEQIVSWYKRTIKCTDKDVTDEIPLDKLLQMQINKKEAYNKKMLVLIFVAILRSLGIQCRLVVSLQVEPLRPPAKDLHSLSTKENDKSKGKLKVSPHSEKKSIKIEVAPSTSKNSTSSSNENKAKKNTKQEPKKNEAKTPAGNLKTKESTKTRTSVVKNVIPENQKSEKNEESTSSGLKHKLEPPKTVRRSKSAESERADTAKRSTRASTQTKSNVKAGSRKSKSVTDVSKSAKEKDFLEVPKTNGRRKRSGSNDSVKSDSSVKSTKSDKSVKTTRSRRSKSLISESKTKSSIKTKLDNVATVKKAKSATDVNKKTKLEVPKPRATRKRSKSNDSVKSDKSYASVKSTKSDKSKKSTKEKRVIKVKAPVRQKQISQVDGTHCSETDDENTCCELVCSEIDDCDDLEEDLFTDSCCSSNTTEESLVNDKVIGLIVPQLDGPSVTVSKAKKPNLSKLTTKKTKQLDVRNDIMNLIKGRISEQKQIDKTRMVKKRKTQHLSESSDSDYVPEPVKKKHHDSEDEFAPKTKVKRRIPSKSLLLAEETGGKPKKIGNDFWVEVFLEAEEKWICADLVFGQVHCVKEIFKRATQPVSYVLAWNNDGSLKDVTQRYCENFNTVTRKLRIDSKWWTDSLKPFMGKQTARDKEEDNDLARQQLDQPLPKSIAEYKNHPLYVLKRHLLKFEGLYPTEPPTLGFVRGEAVYPRGCVFTLHSREIWLKQAKVVKLGEEPYKIVRARPKWDKLSNTVINDQMLEIFGPWQVEDYVPPNAENGKVPRNAFGNVDLFKPCMLPGGCVHLKLPGLNKIARKLNIDCSSAIVGFDFHGGWSVPVYEGFVVCKEYQDALIDAWEEEQLEIARKEEEKIEKRVYGNWKRLIKGLLIRERLNAKYDFGEPSGSGTANKDKKRKSKGPTFSTKKRRIHQNSDSDSN